MSRYADEFLNDIFSTLSLVLIDDEEATVCYSGAGDLPVIKYDATARSLVTHQSTGILLGFSEKVFYDDINIDLADGEEMYLISDGMIDFEIDGEKKSDMNLFKEKLSALKERNEPTENIVNNLFNKHTSQIDDCSIIIIKRKNDEHQ